MEWVKNTSEILKIIKNMKSGKPVKQSLDLGAMKDRLESLTKKSGFELLDDKNKHKKHILDLLKVLN